MWAAGAALGLVWQWWSPPGPAGYQIAPGLIQPDETEAFVAADGRFAAITLAVGVLAALIVWFTRAGRGVPAVFALALGGLGGSAALALVGHAARADGRHYACGTAPATCITHLPLSVQAHGLLFAEAVAAVFVYGLCVSFARADDLGAPDRLRELARSVGADVQLQHAGRHRDGPGGPQQGDLPAQ
jgi:hypothetical protein